MPNAFRYIGKNICHCTLHYNIYEKTGNNSSEHYAQTLIYAFFWIKEEMSYYRTIAIK